MQLFGKTDAAESKPKWLSAADKAKAFFVSVEEAKLATNKAKGILGPGWYLLNEKTDSAGNIRYSAECLVQISVLNAVSGDATDDAKVADAEFAFITSPVATTVIAPAAATFIATAPAGATFKWQVKIGKTQYVDIVDAGVYSGSTTGTLAISDSTGLNGHIYRVIATNAAGTASVTSNGAKLTVTPAE